MTDSSVTEDPLVARSGTESVANPGENPLSRSSASEDNSPRSSAAVAVHIETPRASSKSESESQINITVNPADARSAGPSGEPVSDTGGAGGEPHASRSVLNENSPAAVASSSEGQSETEGRRQSGGGPSLAQQTSSGGTAPSTTSTATSSSSATAEMNGNSGNSSSRASVSGNSSGRRQRNGLFGINIDLNFDPSWLVPSNVAGRSLSVLPDWVRHPANIIPNRGGDNSNSESNARPGHAAHGSSITGSAASRLLSHYHQSTSGSSWNSATPGSSSYNMQQQHGGVPLRTRHSVASARSVDEDLDADYNPTSTLDIAAAGRERGDSNSYVIDMDTPLGTWVAEGEGPSTSQVRTGGPLGGGGSSIGAGGGSPGRGELPDNSNANNSGGPRRSGSESGLPAGGAGDGGSPDGGASPTGSEANNATNERSRAAEILRDAPETRAVLNEISRYTTIRPFILICFLKVIFDHGTSILAFLALIVTFSHANSVVKKEVSKQKKRNLLYLSMIVINLAACVAFIYYIFNEMGLHHALAFLPTTFEVNGFWGLVWVVGVTDYVAKFGTVFVKIAILSLPGCIIPFQKRGKYYLFIEQTSQIYRSFVPVHPWLFYLVSPYQGSSAVFGFFLAGLYVFFKITDSFARFKDWYKALEKLLSNVHYGANPTTKQLDSAGSICPICHDNYASPTRLACGHIFCEECVATWFDRERTCPMCRAKVVDDPTYRDGSTSQYIQLF